MPDEQRVRSEGTSSTLRSAVSLGAVAVAVVHLVWPHLGIDAVTVVLLIVALVPWLAPVFKSLEFPGGWKVEFQELRRAGLRAEQAGLLATAPAQDFAFQRIAEDDPNLALADRLAQALLFREFAPSTVVSKVCASPTVGSDPILGFMNEPSAISPQRAEVAMI